MNQSFFAQQTFLKGKAEALQKVLGYICVRDVLEVN